MSDNEDPNTKPQAKPFDYVDPQKAEFARVFVRRLGGDLSFDGEAKTLEEVLATAYEANGKSWGNVVTALFDSLNETIPDEYIEGPNGERVKAAAHDMPIAVQNVLKKLIVDDGGSADTAVDVAKRLKDANISYQGKNGEQREDKLFNYLYVMGSYEDGRTMNVQLNAEALAMVTDMLNSFMPGMGDVVGSYLRNSGLVHIEEEPETKHLLAEGFDVLNNGNQQSLAAFWGMDTQRENAQGGVEDIIYNPFNFPSKASSQDMFFDGTWREGDKFDLGQGGPLFEEQSFDAMIVQRWVDAGVLNFADEAARQDFVDYAQQIITGRGLVENVMAEMLERGVHLPLDDEDFQSNLNTALTSDYSLDQVTKFLVSKSLLEANPGLTETQLYSYTHDVLERYKRAFDADDFIAKVEDYAKLQEGVTLKLEAGYELPEGSPVPEELDEDDLNQDAHVPKTYEPDPKNAGKPSIYEDENGRDKVVIGGYSAPEHFNFCALGEDDVCRFMQYDWDAEINQIDPNSDLSNFEQEPKGDIPTSQFKPAQGT